MFSEIPILSEIPLPVDRYHLLDILSTDLPLSLTIPKINENVYWRRCYIQRWPKNIPFHVQDVEIVEIVHCNDIRKRSSVYSVKDTESGSGSRISTATKRKLSNDQDNSKKSWKIWYVEMHIREYFENLKPTNYDAQMVSNNKKLKLLSDTLKLFIFIVPLLTNKYYKLKIYRCIFLNSYVYCKI